MTNMESKITAYLFLLLLLGVKVINAYRILVVFPMSSKSHHILGQGVVNNLLEAGHEMESKITAYLFLLLLLGVKVINAYRILVVFPMSSKSHHILGQGVVNNLLEAGHEVVFMTSFPREKPVENLTEIDCSESVSELKKQTDKMDTFKLRNLIGKKNFADSIGFMFFVGEFSKLFLEYEPVKNFLSDPKEKFDLVIMEWFFSETIAGIPPLFQCPYIWIASTEVHGHVLRIIDEVPNPAYSADLFSSNTPPFTFWERAAELVTACWRHFVINFLIVPFEKTFYNRYYADIAAKRGITMPSYEDAVYNASMMLVNSHPSVGTPFKLPQSVKYIGGYHIDRKLKPLPQDLQTIMDNSKRGVIYFSMGSNLQSNDMSAGMKESLLKMFGKLKQDVIWKFEADMQDVPSNVHLMKWAPQTSILAHRNLKLFITHGGQLSTTEAIHFGVPLVGLPMFGDQFVNMQSVVKKGFGIMLHMNEDFAEDLKAAVEEVLNNPEYSNKAKYLSSIYHDRIATPGDELVHWAEHVVRTNGAQHIRSCAVMLPWYQKLYLDLAAVIIVTIIIALYIAKNISKKLKMRRMKEKKN